jgi:hypothetical protein
MRASLMVGSWGLTRMPVGTVVISSRENADGSGGSIQSDGVDEDDAVVAGEVVREVKGGGAEAFEGGVGGACNSRIDSGRRRGRRRRLP